MIVELILSNIILTVFFGLILFNFAASQHRLCDEILAFAARRDEELRRFGAKLVAESKQPIKSTTP